MSTRRCVLHRRAHELPCLIHGDQRFDRFFVTLRAEILKLAGHSSACARPPYRKSHLADCFACGFSRQRCAHLGPLFDTAMNNLCARRGTHFGRRRGVREHTTSTTKRYKRFLDAPHKWTDPLRHEENYPALTGGWAAVQAPH
eukprot:3112596-Pyramimonas_sp.AAC.1